MGEFSVKVTWVGLYTGLIVSEINLVLSTKNLNIYVFNQ